MNNLNKSLTNFVDTTQRLAKKYKAKVSIGYAGKEVVLADERENLPIKTNTPMANSFPSVQQIMLFEDDVKISYSALKLTKEELKKKRQMFKDGLENDSEYFKLIEESKELTRKKKQLAQELTKGALFSLKQDIEDLKIEIKDQQTSLSDYLYAYATNTKKNSIELNNEEHRIVKNFKVQKKRV